MQEPRLAAKGRLLPGHILPSSRVSESLAHGRDCLPSDELDDRGKQASGAARSGIRRPPQRIRAAEGMYVGYYSTL